MWRHAPSHYTVNMSRQASASYWLCHAVVFTLACALLVGATTLVNGFSLRAATTRQTTRPSRKQFSALHENQQQQQQPAVFILRLDHRQTVVALSASKLNEGADAIIPDDLNEKLASVTAKTGKQADAAAAAAAAALHTAPPVSFDKFLTMQDKRVVVTVQYSGDSGLRPYFLTVAKKLKASHPDVIIERRILAEGSGSEGGGGQSEATFEVLVDGKLAVGKGHSQKQKVARVDMSKTRSVFVSMQELDLAISRARRRRRPNSVVYGAATSSNTPAMESSSSSSSSPSVSAAGRW
jgi:hypothetical protein